MWKQGELDSIHQHCSAKLSSDLKFICQIKILFYISHMLNYIPFYYDSNFLIRQFSNTCSDYVPKEITFENYMMKFYCLWIYDRTNEQSSKSERNFILSLFFLCIPLNSLFFTLSPSNTMRYFHYAFYWFQPNCITLP